MTSFRFVRNSVFGCIAGALVSACGGSTSTPVIAPTQAPLKSKTFHFTGSTQRFTVPAGVAQLEIAAYGAPGSGVAARGSGRPGGRGAVIVATIPVKANQVLTIVVGGKAQGSDGGFNGGAGGAYGGGGASDVRTGDGALTDRIIVAGGGGGAGASFEWASTSTTLYWCYGGPGGHGGTKTGGVGGDADCGGGGGGIGGSQHNGGDGGYAGPYEGPSRGGSPGCAGTAGSAGALLSGGTGGTECSGPGGGGGGGYYGGGGGGSGGCCSQTGAGTAAGGGAGGSSFVEKSATNVQETSGAGPRGDGKVIISWR